MKTKFNIEVQESERFLGGYLTTTEPMTDKQVIKWCKKQGREAIENNDYDEYQMNIFSIGEDGESDEIRYSVIVKKFQRGNWISCDYTVIDKRNDNYDIIEDSKTERECRKIDRECQQRIEQGNRDLETFKEMFDAIRGRRFMASMEERMVNN